MDKTAPENTLSYHVPEAYHGRPAADLLERELGLSTRLIRRLKRSEGLLINGKPAKVKALVKTGDEIRIVMDRDKTQNIAPEPIPVPVVYEDDDLLIVDKQPGIVVHPTRSHPNGTLANGVMNYWHQKGKTGIVRLVNRLDRDTSGLVVIAKNPFTQSHLARQMDAGRIEKLYLAVVHGHLAEPQGTVELPIDLAGEGYMRRTVTETGKLAVTHYRVVTPLHDATLVELKLDTGKTHQIRVHMSHLGHPIIGDTLYGTPSPELIRRQALHAWRLRFTHPRSGLPIAVEASLPGDMVLLISKLSEGEKVTEDEK